MAALKRYWIVIVVFILVGLFYFSSPLSYLKTIVKNEIKTSNRNIDSLNKEIKNYKPNEIYIKKIDSLQNELNKLKKNPYVKTKYIYINSSYKDKFKLLADRISKDSL